MAKKSKTVLKKLNIVKFRALKNVNVEFGETLTVICGKNGTSKSSILGIAAQIFSFEKDYVKDENLNYKQITGSQFKSQYRDHFRISEKFDTSGTMEVNVELFDGYTNQESTGQLELSKRGSAPRPVLRKNSTVQDNSNTSRNFTHPVIFLSLKRLLPITDREYNVNSIHYFNTNKVKFISLTNELLNRTSSSATGTSGTISSAVSHGDNYDQDSVSAGEDNAGQIMLALMSFRKLKEEYADYKGGLLLIDEADAGLFPAAQTKLVDIFERECKELNLQVVITTHSPTLIEYAYELSQKYQRKYKTVYLSDTFGPVQTMHDMSWQQINADIHTRTVADENVSLPKINVYFEDREGFDFYKALLHYQKINKFLSPLPEVTLGCSNYIQLVTKSIPEFAAKSIICLDADVKEKLSPAMKSIVLLPGHLPPDQLIFEYLYNLPADHKIWNNPVRFTRPVFTDISSEIINGLNIQEQTINLSELITNYHNNETEQKKKLRVIFKAFYKHTAFQRFLKQNIKQNPWHNWINDNIENSDDFLYNFNELLTKTMKKAFFVDSEKLSLLKVKYRGR
ncbi:AAA family ATPase [Pantoea agglomerans]|uniref:AAA family ATPase n=1 Tax=Enterobacter agglomerans TaxID=549 RepID=UPI00301C66BC